MSRSPSVANTSTMELVRIVQAAERIGADFVQVSPPFYFSHTEDDYYEHVLAAADAGAVGLILYNTFWTSLGLSTALVERLARVPNVVGLKWAAPDTGEMVSERMMQRFASRFAIIDNQVRYVISHMLGARAIETHIGNFWPQWAIGLWSLLERGAYVEAQAEVMRVALPYYDLWGEMERFTAGDGYLNRLCLEAIGFPTSAFRPPTRDVRPQFGDRTRQMLLAIGAPGVVDVGTSTREHQLVG